MMRVMSVSESRSNYAQTLDSVVDDHEEVLVVRPKGRNVVLVSEEDYVSLTETLYLMSTPANAEVLHAGLEEFRAGMGKRHSLDDPR